MRLNEQPLLTAAQIEARIAEIAREISDRYAGRDPVLVAVLKGAAIFAADLMRRLTVPACLDFIRARSYAGTESQGRVRITFLPEHSLEGRHVIVVEDILDTGRTTSAVLDCIRQQNPASLVLCTLLDKPARRVVPVKADYTGFRIDNLFVVGYGLDYDERYRHFPDIRTLEE